MNKETIMDMNNKMINNNDFVCPNCHFPVVASNSYLSCEKCNIKYPIIDNVPDFRGKDSYWCNVSREKMNLLIKRSRETGDWEKSAKEIVPEYIDHINRYDRADAQFMLPIGSDSRVLDAGSMWGGLSVPLAQYCKEVVSLDKTLETLRYLRVRCIQYKRSNIKVVASLLNKMPFKDNHFDCVVLNGVLEWVGFDDELVLERHWGKRRKSALKYVNSPRNSQLDTLKEIKRVLKPDGFLFLAIENRYGYPYFVGQPDDHVNIRFVPFLPRFLANVVTKIKINSEYRTYIYGINELQKLLKEGGFINNKLHAVFPHYGEPSAIMPLVFVKKLFKSIVKPDKWYKNMLLNIIPTSLYKYFSPSLISISYKDVYKRESMIECALKQATVINNDDVNIVKYGGRQGNYLTSNFLIYINTVETPDIFCKVCRDNRHTQVLVDENNNLEKIKQLLKNSPIDKTFPEKVYFGATNGITMLCTKFKSGKIEKIELINYEKPHRLIKRIDKIINKCIEYLVEFQKKTEVSKVNISDVFKEISLRQGPILSKTNNNVKDHLKKFENELKDLKDIKIPICAEHGDYDLCNIQIIDGICNLFDFEHFIEEGRPFFDLANLLFNIFLANESLKGKDHKYACDIFKNVEVKYFIREKLILYSRLSGMPKEVLNLMGPISVLEHRNRKFPFYRDPKTYPIYKDDALDILLEWRPGL